jgi:adenylate cyclase
VPDAVVGGRARRRIVPVEDGSAADPSFEGGVSRGAPAPLRACTRIHQNEDAHKKKHPHHVSNTTVVESVRLMQEDEAGFIDRWRRFVHEVRTVVLPKHGGRMVKSLGDGMLLEFAAVPSATQAALRVHEHAHSVCLSLRAGVHVDDLVVDELDVYGNGVNLAARLAGLASPGETLVSPQARDQLVDSVDVDLVDLGECFLKHYEQAIRAYRISTPSAKREPSAASVDDYRPSIAVVPFAVQDISAEHHALGSALADDLIAALSRRADLRVISRLSTAAFSHVAASTQVVAASLSVAYVVCGSVEMRGEDARVAVELSDARSGDVMWADIGHVRIADVFAAADTFMPQVVAHIGHAVLRQELRRARSLPLSSLRRYTIYHASIALLHRLVRTDFERARELLEHLCEREPRSPAPHAMLAKWHMLRMVQGWSASAPEDVSRITDHVRRALDRDPDHAFALSLHAHATAHYVGDLAAALEIAQRSSQADAQEPNAWLILSGIHSYLGRGSEAAPLALRARDLSPLDPARFLFDLFLAAAHLAADRYDAASECARESIRRNAAHPAAYRCLVIAEMLAGHGEQARRAANDLIRLAPTYSVSGYLRGYPGREQPHARIYAAALRDAGLPD